MAAILPQSEARISQTAAIRALVQNGEIAQARADLAALISRLFGLAVAELAINADQYSLNSLNGFFSAGTEQYFFKFHQEEGEEAMTGEYYRAGLLARAGLPVDMPLYMSALPGEQILVYRRRDDARFADILRALDLNDDPALRAEAVRAEAALNDEILAIARHDLHPITRTEAAAEPVHSLFHARLTTPSRGIFPGGRYKNFYIGQPVALAGATLDWDDFAARRFVINGVRYRDTIAGLFTAAASRLRPEALADAGGVVAHGDAHNANIWYHREDGIVRLEFFDPAFAGAHVPALLAEVKSTFHNILAHPFWLYDSAIAEARFYARVTLRDDDLLIDTDWCLNAIRRDLLDIKITHFWRPWLATLAQSGLLPADWRRVIRLALFLCPTLVMNLRAGAGRHNPVSSTIGFACAMMAGSEPEGEDFISRFFDMIDPARRD